MEMTVPTHIQAQMEAANELQAKLYGPKGAPAAPETPVAENTPTEAVADPTPPVTAPAVEPVTSASTEDTYEARYKVLKGKYDAEVPRLHLQVQGLTGKLDELTSRLEQAMKPVEKPAETLTNDKDVEVFGADLMEAVDRKATDVFNRMAKQLMTEIDKRSAALSGQVEAIQGRVVQSEADKFWTRVEALVPDWQKIDNDEKWIEFLDSTPEFTTETYRELASKAIQAGDPNKIAKLVAVWRGTAAPAQPAAAPKQPNRELQRQVAPSTARSSTPAASPKTWTAAEYEYVFSPKAIHEVAKPQLEAMQADAQLALAEGRVRW